MKVRFRLGIATLSGAQRQEGLVFNSFRNDTVATARRWVYPTLTPNNHWRGLIVLSLSRIWWQLYTQSIDAFNEYAISYNAEHLRLTQLTVRGYNMFIKALASGWLINDASFPSTPGQLLEMRGNTINMIINNGYLPRVRRKNQLFDEKISYDESIRPSPISQSIEELHQTVVEYQALYQNGTLHRMYTEQKIDAMTKYMGNLLSPDDAVLISHSDLRDIATDLCRLGQQMPNTTKSKRKPSSKQENILIREKLLQYVRTKNIHAVLNEDYVDDATDVPDITPKKVKESLKDQQKHQPKHHPKQGE